ncbi:conserved hypothetical protein [Ricinus communis]|uniref:Uncharacterized protein n=1 Tax=Ricinus communis TaxID=3988 RepID=B9SSA0_RICCO|nr:conserved hypothetical protein [Ricinus communis]
MPLRKVKLFILSLRDARSKSVWNQEKGDDSDDEEEEGEGGQGEGVQGEGGQSSAAQVGASRPRSTTHALLHQLLNGQNFLRGQNQHLDNRQSRTEREIRRLTYKFNGFMEHQRFFIDSPPPSLMNE